MYIVCLLIDNRGGARWGFVGSDSFFGDAIFILEN